MATEKPNFYAILPADVRYDEAIPPNAKLLYAEISALTGSEGFCFATNDYFAQLYGMTVETISRLIAKLEKAGYIRRLVDRDDTGQIVGRRLFLTASVSDGHPLDEKINTSPQKNQGGIDEKVKDNITRDNIEKENIKEKASASGKRTPLTDAQLRELFIGWINKIAPDYWTAKDKNTLYFALDGFYATRENKKQEPARTAAAFTALSNRLSRYSADSPAVMIDMLERATTAGWKSVYPLNGDRHAAPPSDGGGDVEWL